VRTKLVCSAFFKYCSACSRTKSNYNMKQTTTRIQTRRFKNVQKDLGQLIHAGALIKRRDEVSSQPAEVTQTCSLFAFEKFSHATATATIIP